MDILEHEKIGAKTTMKIGGTARYYGEIATKEDVVQAHTFAKEKNIPLITFGGGSNTVFADGEVNALVCRMKADKMDVSGNVVRVEPGKILGSMLFELAEHDLDFSKMTGILGTMGGAVFGNAGQGFTGTWINSFIKEVTFFLDGEWKTWTNAECNFRYRESGFKDLANAGHLLLIWETVLELPSRPKEEIKADIAAALKRRTETQLTLKTAGSFIKTQPDGTMAWQLIDAAGLRGKRIGGVEISEKHANFLVNVENGSFNDVVEMDKLVREKIPQIPNIEMRLYGEDGRIVNG